jgi:phosphoglycolate phosphatase-like HAD superfamily hydrolase
VLRENFKQIGGKVKVLLFDIDGTLILSGGAGLRAMNRAFFELHQVPDAFDGISLSGRTDTWIVETAMTRAGIPVDNTIVNTFKERYFLLLQEEISKPGNNKRIMPGVEHLLDILKSRDSIILGLLSGNWEKSGRIKLAHFNLSHLFKFGAFADDSGDRNMLLPFAMQRFVKSYKLKPRVEDIFIIGDTPFDIKCAKPHGVKSVAVGAAHYSVDELAQYSPDHLLSSLEKTDDFMDILES